MSEYWSDNTTISISGTTTPLVVTRNGDSIIVSTSSEDEYELLNAGCEKCGHPSFYGSSCSTCDDWESLVYAKSMGIYVPPKRQEAGKKYPMTKNLLMAKNRTYTAKLLGSVLGIFARNEWPQLLNCSAVIPVPAFKPPSHSERICRAFCKVLSHGGLNEDLVVRTGNTRIRRLSRAERRKTTRKEFQPGNGNLAPGSTVLVVDDILTDGSTLDACACALREKGAGSVFGITVARTI